MCDRPKYEVLARELCIIEWQTKNRRYAHLQKKPLPVYVDAHWELFADRAKSILEVLETHDQ